MGLESKVPEERRGGRGGGRGMETKRRSRDRRKWSARFEERGRDGGGSTETEVERHGDDSCSRVLEWK